MKVFKPLNGRVVIKLDEPQEVSVGGIVLPNTHSLHDNIRYGVVREINPEEKQLKVGDQVMFGWSGDEFEIDKEKYVLLESKAVLAKVE